MSERFHFDVDGERLTAFVYQASKPLGATLLLAHGASAGQKDRFIVDYATELAGRGVLVVTFDFPYMEHRRRHPDRDEVLQESLRAAAVAAGQCRPKNRLFIGGKSLGGRVAAEVAAEGGEGVDDVAGVIVLGYPLHPIGKATASRAQHLRDLHVPVLVVQGTRDAFGTPDELRRVVSLLPDGSEVYAVDGGDHSFAVSRRGAHAQEDAEAEIQDEIARWISEIASPRRAAAAARAPAHPRRIATHARTQLRSLRRSARA